MIKNEIGMHGKEIFRAFSKQSKKYDLKTFNKYWDAYRPNKDGLKIGTLIKMAQEDNKELYEKRKQ